MGKHTAGPWVAVRDCFCDGDQDYESYRIRPSAWQAGEIARVVGGNGPMVPNARLIAAAPDLLEAAEGLIDAACEASSRGVSAEIRRMAIPDAFFDAARAAIARARGEE